MHRASMNVHGRAGSGNAPLTRRRRACRLTVFLGLPILSVAAVSAQPTQVRPSPVSDQLTQALDEFDAAQQIQSEQPDRAKRLFFSAAQRFTGVAQTGIANGPLEYNIGNAYLQAGDVGRAILHYRRAERFNPNDPLLKDNLSLARSKRLTSIAPAARGEVLRSFLFWHYGTAVKQRALAATVLYVACWGLLVFGAWRPRTALAVSAVLCLVLAGAAAGSVAATRWSEKHAPDGVVLAMDVPVYKGPGPSYRRQFEQPLQPGVEFRTRERRGAWWNIELPDGKTGWIEGAGAELIPTDYSGSLELVVDS